MFFAAVMGVSLLSCSSDDSLANQEQKRMTEDEFAKNVSFVKTPLAMTMAYSKTVTSVDKPVLDSDIVILRLTIGRKSRGCRGFGICDFKLFPRETHFIELVESLQDNEYIARGYYDAQDDKVYAELLLDKPAPDYVYPLLVEEDLYWVKDEIALEEIHQYTGEDYDISKDKLLDNDYYQIKADSIAFDSSLGENGGYQIVLEK